MEKILKLQSEIGVLVKTENNPFFKSKYLDINALLEQLQPLLEKYKLCVVQPLRVIDGKSALRTIVWDTEDEQNTGGYTNILCESDILLPDIQDPQKMGSAITYYRRYALQSLFLLRAEDDDANHASSPKTTPAQTLAKNVAKQTPVDNSDVPF